MSIFREFFKTQSDQNILQNALNCTKLHQTAPNFQNFLGELAYAPEPPSIYVQLYLMCISIVSTRK